MSVARRAQAIPGIPVSVWPPVNVPGWHLAGQKSGGKLACVALAAEKKTFFTTGHNNRDCDETIQITVNDVEHTAFSTSKSYLIVGMLVQDILLILVLTEYPFFSYFFKYENAVHKNFTCFTYPFQKCMPINHLLPFHSNIRYNIKYRSG